MEGSEYEQSDCDFQKMTESEAFNQGTSGGDFNSDTITEHNATPDRTPDRTYIGDDHNKKGGISNDLPSEEITIEFQGNASQAKSVTLNQGNSNLAPNNSKNSYSQNKVGVSCLEADNDFSMDYPQNPSNLNNLNSQRPQPVPYNTEQSEQMFKNSEAFVIVANEKSKIPEKPLNSHQAIRQVIMQANDSSVQNLSYLSEIERAKSVYSKVNSNMTPQQAKWVRFFASPSKTLANLIASTHLLFSELERKLADQYSFKSQDQYQIVTNKNKNLAALVNKVSSILLKFLQGCQDYQGKHLDQKPNKSNLEQIKKVIEKGVYLEEKVMAKNPENMLISTNETLMIADLWKRTDQKSKAMSQKSKKATRQAQLKFYQDELQKQSSRNDNLNLSVSSQLTANKTKEQVSSEMVQEIAQEENKNDILKQQLRDLKASNAKYEHLFEMYPQDYQTLLSQQ